MLLYLPALDFLTHSYIPNADLAHQVPFGTFETDSDSISSSAVTTMTEIPTTITTTFGWFRIIYLLAFLAYFFTRKVVLSVDLPFGTVLQSKLCYNDPLFEHFRIIFILILSIVDWRVREHGLSPLVIDIISCCFGISQVFLGLKWMTYHYYKTHLLYGLISSFYLSHSVILLVRHQLEANLLSSMLDTMSVTKILDVAYFSTGIFCMWVYYNIYEKLYSLHVSSDSNSPLSLPVITEKYFIHKLLDMKNEKRLDAEIVNYLQAHFSVCSDSESCPCAKLLLEPETELSFIIKGLKWNYNDLHDTRAVEEFMAARLTYLLTTPNSRFYGKLGFLVRVISYLVFQLDKPVQACMMVARFSTIMKSKAKKFEVFYEYFLNEIKGIATHSMTEEQSALYNYNVCDGIAFDESLQQVRSKEEKIRAEYTEFFSYLYENAFVDLQKIQQIGRKLVEQIEELEDTFEKLSNMNPENTELIMMIMEFRKNVREESGHPIASLNTRLVTIFQKRSILLHHKATGQKALFSPEDNLDEKTMFMMVDLFQNHGHILKASQNFYKAFAINKELESNITLNSIILPHMREAHQNALLQMIQKTSTLLTNHKFEDLIFGLSRENLLVPLHLYSKIEVQGSQVYAAASLQTEDQKRYIVVDEKGSIISFTKNLEHLLEGVQYSREGRRMNICLLIPALIPVIFGKEQPVKQILRADTFQSHATISSPSTVMIMTHRLLQRKSSLAVSKEYLNILQQFIESADIRSLTSSLINFLETFSNESVLIHGMKLKSNYRKFQSFGVGYWEIEVTKLEQTQQEVALKEIIPLLKAETGFQLPFLSARQEETERSPSHTLLPVPSWATQNLSKIENGLDESKVFTIPEEKPEENLRTLQTGRLLHEVTPRTLHTGRLLLEGNSNIITGLLDYEKSPIGNIQIQRRNSTFYDSQQSQFSQIHLPRMKQEVEKKRGNRSVGRSSSSGSAGSATTSTSGVIRKVIKENNSLRLIQTHYYAGIIAAIAILVMMITQFLVTDSAINELEHLATMNIHPTQSATFLQRSMFQSYIRGLLDKQLLNSSSYPQNEYFLMYYHNNSMQDLPYLLRDPSANQVLGAHIREYPVPVIQVETRQVYNMSIINAVNLALSYGYTRAIEAQQRVNTTGDYYPRIFGELNTRNIVDNLLTYMTNVHLETEHQLGVTVSLNQISFVFGCLSTFVVLICLALVYSKIKNKQNSLLALFCKISKRDLKTEAFRLAEITEEKPKIKNNDNNHQQGQHHSERLFTTYLPPKKNYVSRTAVFFLVYGILLVPFLVCFIEIWIYSTNWEAGLHEYNSWELTRTAYVGMYAKAAAVYFNADSNETRFQESLNLFYNEMNEFRTAYKDFQELYTDLAFSKNHLIYSRDTLSEIKDSLSQNFCPFVRDEILTESTCDEALGSIPKTGLLNTISYVADVLEKNVLMINSSSERAATMKSIGYDSAFDETTYMIVATSRTLRLYSTNMNDDMLDYLSHAKNTLLIILVASVIGYSLLMLIGWTMLVRKFSQDLDQTKKILDILPTRLLQGNSFIRNTLIKIMRVNIAK